MQNEECCYRYKNKQEIKMIRNREKQVTHWEIKETIKDSLLWSLSLIYSGAFKPLLIPPLNQCWWSWYLVVKTFFLFCTGFSILLACKCSCQII